MQLHVLTELNTGWAGSEAGPKYHA